MRTASPSTKPSGGAVTTSGAQGYNDTVTLVANTTGGAQQPRMPDIGMVAISGDAVTVADEVGM